VRYRHFFSVREPPNYLELIFRNEKPNSLDLIFRNEKPNSLDLIFRNARVARRIDLSGISLSV
jgi:hypothetical protein